MLCRDLVGCVEGRGGAGRVEKRSDGLSVTYCTKSLQKCYNPEVQQRRLQCERRKTRANLA